ncbi:hypothetical protein LXD69_02815 [Flavobacterium sediminilitoris]|uniref:Exosortase F-associated protein n=1 Tax=Flavobacterium sediminilitoris TaxID=2024526 RepID=A0ABY4HSE3_9FLAO|nr:MULTISPECIES: hypothetical protein [Flavobacterium]UOX34449.1 hypothetical protein LXD69_02815 [Flavobacterium sediminilitoris]
MKANQIIKIIIVLLIVYCVLAIVRSSNLLYIAYTDDYFYNFKFEPSLLIQKYPIYINANYTYTYIIGIILSISFKWLLDVDWKAFVIAIILGLTCFRLLDSSIRPLFGLFQNIRLNIIFHLVTFIVLLFLMLFLFKRIKFLMFQNENDKQIS